MISMSSFVCFASFFLGTLKATSSNNFVMILISFEMMVFGIFLFFISKIWAMMNVHFFSVLLVFSVLEGVMGLSVMVTIFSNSSKLEEGVSSSLFV